MASNYDFGIIGSETGALGVYQSVEETRDAKQVELSDQVGDIIETIEYAKVNIIDFTLIMNKTKSAPAIGATITATSVMHGTSKLYKVQPGIKLSHSFDKHQVLTFQGKQYLSGTGGTTIYPAS